MRLLNIFFFFFFNDTATTEIYTLSLHDALPIFALRGTGHGRGPDGARRARISAVAPSRSSIRSFSAGRSEEHTSELQSPCNLVCRLLLEKKKKKSNQTTIIHNEIIQHAR